MNLDSLLGKGVVEVIGRDTLERAITSGKKLRIKFGADPTSAHLHLGTAVVLWKLRVLQDAGHKIVFVIGDFTARIGDPSERSKTRPMLSDKEIKANAKTYFQQVGKILNIKKAEIVYNSKWFSKLKLADFIKLASQFTAQRILERDDFTKRLKEGTEIYAHELMYPMLQAYDSVQVKADVEIGGTDQTFNMLAGRDLQRHMATPEQAVITLPLLVGTDGTRKMSKSLDNAIGITEKPEMMFGKIMSIPDSAINQYYDLCTTIERTASDPREAKLILAKTIVEQYHGSKAAQQAYDEFIRVVSNGGMPTDIPSFKVNAAQMTVVDLLVITKLAESKGEARRLIEQGGVKINEEKQSDPNKVIILDKEIVLQVGKRNFIKVIK